MRERGGIGPRQRAAQNDGWEYSKCRDTIEGVKISTAGRSHNAPDHDGCFMYHLPLTLASPEENLALDEALLDDAETGTGPEEVLRIWESPRAFVVLGRSSRLASEVKRRRCRQEGVPILRRSSGGATVLVGPGCLMYSLVLSLRDRPDLRAVPQAHAHVLDRHVASLRKFAPDLRRQGTSDLAVRNRKVSGNSLRIKRTHMLYHGTLLYEFSVDGVQRLLTMPPRQPAYRERRDHSSFLSNLNAPVADLRQALMACWNAGEPLECWPRDEVARLVERRYTRQEWTHAF